MTKKEIYKEVAEVAQTLKKLVAAGIMLGEVRAVDDAVIKVCVKYRCQPIHIDGVNNALALMADKWKGNFLDLTLGNGEMTIKHIEERKKEFCMIGEPIKVSTSFKDLEDGLRVYSMKGDI